MAIAAAFEIGDQQIGRGLGGIRRMAIGAFFAFVRSVVEEAAGEEPALQVDRDQIGLPGASARRQMAFSAYAAG